MSRKISACDAIEQIILPRLHDLGAFSVRRALPAATRQMIGPFIFLDQMGPTHFGVGEGIDVRPHPHIGLSTLTYLFDGEIRHRDSLGFDVAIKPGAVNLMTAGRGITHSERTGPDWRARGGRLEGLQTWLALPARDEETDPAFTHLAQKALPVLEDAGIFARIIAGAAYGLASPLKVHADALFVDLTLTTGARIPVDAQTEERGLYISAGAIDIEGMRFDEGRLIVLKPGVNFMLCALEPTRLALLGGAAMDGPRHIWWNFVSSRKERIAQARADWRAGRFAPVPGETDFIPLPE